MAPVALPTFAQRLIRWQKKHGRHDLPWQNTRDPYRVWLSEIMLQQTQVTTVIPYYERFLARFPTLATLAEAPVDEVMAYWAGLGYYARARNLHACARIVVTRFGGRFPCKAEEIAALPGIGRSTANAIAVFCFGAHLPILDGNVKRLLCRHAGISGWPGSPAVEGQAWRYGVELLPKREVATYIQAQMDMGASVCTRSRPRCEHCPVAADCVALRDGRTAELPTPKPRKPLDERATRVLLLIDGDAVLLQARPPTGIWGGLLSLPEVDTTADVSAAVTRLGCTLRTLRDLPSFAHTFTHFRLNIFPTLCFVEHAATVAEATAHWWRFGDLNQAPLPSPVRRLLEAARTASA